MADTFTTITAFINSPPGQLAAGGVLGGIVWKFFKHVGDALNEQTNREIARWLRVKKFETGIISEEADSWPYTFVKMFDRVFGEKHLSWKCFLRSSIASCIAIAITLLVTFAIHNLNWYVAKNIIEEAHLGVVVILLVANVIPDYLSLLETRFLLGFACRSSSPVYLMGILTVDFIVTLYIALVSVTYGLSTVLASTYSGLSTGTLVNPRVLLNAFSPLELYLSLKLLNEPGVASLWFFPAFFTSIWLWLYAGSGYLLRAARRFDIGLDWFNRTFDIEKKPLQSIGLVAGALVAVLYWTAAIIRHFVS
jgi:hypothetical protein